MKHQLIFFIGFWLTSIICSAQTGPSDTIIFKDLKRFTSFLNYSVGEGSKSDNINRNQRSISDVNLPSEFSVQKWADGFQDWSKLKKVIDEKIGSNKNEFLESYRAYIISTQSYFLEDNTPEVIKLKILFLDDLSKNGGRSFHVYYALLNSLKGKASDEEFKVCLLKVLDIGLKKMENDNNVLGKKFFPMDADADHYGIAESTERINYYYHLIKKL